MDYEKYKQALLEEKRTIINSLRCGRRNGFVNTVALDRLEYINSLLKSEYNIGG